MRAHRGAGLLVGGGTYIGNGCTSGHGICGNARLSMRSLLATLTFMAFGAASAAAFNTGEPVRIKRSMCMQARTCVCVCVCAPGRVGAQ